MEFTVKRICLLACSVLLGSSNLGMETHAQDSIHVERFPALTLDDAIRAIETQPGFEVELVASEPQIASPVAMEFDAAGDLWVAEMLDYSEQEHEALGRVSRLRDRDLDGVMDEKR